MSEILKKLNEDKKQYEQTRRQIAKLAWHEMKAVVDKWESNEDVDVSLYWEEVVGIDGVNFEKMDFEEKEDDK